MYSNHKMVDTTSSTTFIIHIPRNKATTGVNNISFLATVMHVCTSFSIGCRMTSHLSIQILTIHPSLANVVRDMSSSVGEGNDAALEFKRS